VGWIGGRSERLGGLVSCFGCHAAIIAPDRRARLRLSRSWSLLGQSATRSGISALTCIMEYVGRYRERRRAAVDEELFILT
jgi:hypothetical protein